MFCIQCGKELSPEANFCAGCGTKNAALETQSRQAPAGQSPATVAVNPQKMKPLFVLSIIAICWHSTYFFSYLFATDRPTVYWITFFVFGFAIAHAIVAIKMGNKHGIQQLKTMGILGIVWYLASSIGMLIMLASSYQYIYDAGRWTGNRLYLFPGSYFPSAYINLSLLIIAYPLAFGIISLIASRNIPKAVNSKKYGMAITALVYFVIVIYFWLFHKEDIKMLLSHALTIVFFVCFFAFLPVFIAVFLGIKCKNKLGLTAIIAGLILSALTACNFVDWFMW